MRRPNQSRLADPRVSLLACISLMGLGILVGNLVGGSIGSSVAMLLVLTGSMFGLSYLRKVRR